MKYLRIANKGIAPVESFTMLGVSSSRYKDDKIGQFGSGSKHGILTLLRNGTPPVILIGECDRLEFDTKPITFKGEEYKQVVCIHNGVRKELSYSLEFGAIDWTAITMALREFVSNAIDASERIDDVVIELIDGEPVPYTDETVVYIPATPEIIQFYNRKEEYFLHFVGKQDITILTKRDRSPARIFRRGVFVRQMENKDSLFDYNFQDMDIDECRNASDSEVEAEIGGVLFSNEQVASCLIQKMADASFEHMTKVEFSLPSWRIRSDKDLIKKVFKRIYGDSVICRDDNSQTLAARKGIKCVKVPYYWYQMFIDSGIRTFDSITNIGDRKGVMYVKSDPNIVRDYNRIWRKLNNAGLTRDLPKPKLSTFECPANADCILHGFQHGDTVYINNSDTSSTQTILEELAHYITKSEDFTRDFQSFAFLVAAKFIN